MKPAYIIIALSGLGLAVYFFLWAACGGNPFPQNTGRWDDVQVFWKRTWSSGATNTLSFVGLYRMTPDGLMHGPEFTVHDGTFEYVERVDQNGEVFFRLVGTGTGLSIRLTDLAQTPLVPFEVIDDDFGPQCFYGWSGTRDVFQVDSFLRMSPSAENPFGSVTTRAK